MTYRSLAPSLAAAIPQSNSTKLSATVLKVDASGADVQLSDGSIFRRLKVAGGIAAVGATVEVQFDSGVAPYIVAQGGTSAVGGVVVGSSSGGGVSGSGVSTTRLLTAGLGLYGGGDLSADRTFNVGQGDGISVAADTVAVDATVVRTTRLITSGAGITGGGDLSADRTLAVGAGTGITVNADDVAVNQAYAFNWTAMHTFIKTGTQVRLAHDVGNYTDFTVGSGGNLLVAPTGDFIFDPVGNDILPNTGYDLNIGSLQKKYLTLHAAELWVETLVAQDTIATIGGRILVTPTTKLTRDLSNSASTEATITQRGSATSATGSSASNTIEFIGVSAVAANNTTNITVNIPPGTLQGHVMLAGVNYWADLTLTAPSGWTLVRYQDLSAGAGRLAIYYKVATASEPSNYNWTTNFADYTLATIASYSGVDNTNPIGVSGAQSNTSASTSATAPSITTTNANAKLVYMAAVDAGVNVPVLNLTATPPTSFTERADTWSKWKWIYHADYTQASAGASGTKVATLDASRQTICALIELKPASNTTQAAPSKPTGTTTNDVVFFMAAYSSTTAILTAPVGLIEINNTTTSSFGTVRWYYKVAGASEPSTYTFGLNSADDLSVLCVAYSNVNTTSPIDSYSATGYGSGTTMRSNPVSPVASTSMLLFAGAATQTGAGAITLTPPSGMSELIDTGTGLVRIYLATLALSTSGSTGEKTATLSSGKVNVANMFALRPAVSGGSNTIYVEHNQMQTGDIAYMQADGKIEWIAITSNATTVTQGAEYSYTVTRNLDGTGANLWYAGDAVANTGTAGSGFIDLYSLESIRGLTLDHIYVYNPASGGTYSANMAQETSFGFRGEVAGSITTNTAAYYGMENEQFSAYYHYIAQVEVVSGGGGTLEYWNGSTWTALIGATLGGNATYGVTGFTSWHWTPALQTGWAKTTVNGVNAYWIRDRTTSGTWSQVARQGGRRVLRGKNTWGPTIAGMVRQSGVFNDVKERWAVGNLNGLYDFGDNVYGAAFGDPLKTWLSIDAGNETRIGNGIRIMNGATTLGSWDTAGDIRIGNPAMAHTYISAGVMKLRNGENDVVTLSTTANAYGEIATFDGIVGVSINGAFQAGQGNVILDNNGLSLRAGLDNRNVIKFYNDATLVGKIWTQVVDAVSTVTLENVAPTGTKYVSLNATEVAITGNLSVSGSVPAGLKLPRSNNLAATFGVDVSGTGSALSMSTGTTATLFGTGNNFSGMLLINDTNSGNCGLYVIGGTIVTTVATSGGFFANAVGASGVNVYYTGGGSYNLTVQNITGGTVSLNIFAIRTRAAA